VERELRGRKFLERRYITARLNPQRALRLRLCAEDIADVPALAIALQILFRQEPRGDLILVVEREPRLFECDGSRANRRIVAQRRRRRLSRRFAGRRVPDVRGPRRQRDERAGGQTEPDARLQK